MVLVTLGVAPRRVAPLGVQPDAQVLGRPGAGPSVLPARPEGVRLVLQRTPKEAWPPDYGRIKRQRAARLRILLQDLSAQRGAKLASARGPEGCIAFIEDWCETFDPRNAGTDRPTTMPFILFQRQREYIEFLYACYKADADG